MGVESTQRHPKSTQRASKWTPKGSQMTPKGEQMDPTGTQMDPKGNQMEPKVAPKTPKGSQGLPLGSQGRPKGAKRKPQGPIIYPQTPDQPQKRRTSNPKVVSSILTRRTLLNPLAKKFCSCAGLKTSSFSGPLPHLRTVPAHPAHVRNESHASD